MLRVVIDTNTWVSGLIWPGHPKQLITRVLLGDLRSITSPELAAEFQRVLAYDRLHKAMQKRGMNTAEVAAQFGLISDVIPAPALSAPVCRDPDDDAVLACALAAKADWIVSGDKDLLVLQSFAGIPIVTAAQALERLVA
jgi:uncharacterized protein